MAGAEGKGGYLFSQSIGKCDKIFAGSDFLIIAAARDKPCRFLIYREDSRDTRKQEYDTKEKPFHERAEKLQNEYIYQRKEEEVSKVIRDLQGIYVLGQL